MGDALMTLFREVADLPPAAREQFYESRNTPPEVREEVELLLRFDPARADPAGESLTGIVAEAENQLRTTGTSSGTQSTVFGAYRAIRLLGSGGMGAVFLAERTDGELDRRVAVKVAHFGMNIAAFRERFLAERRILASLNHAGIVQLLDAGHSSDGQPYFVMEYVDGVAIDQYCSRLDPREILRLFLRVCDAVSYAHRNLVIHRDLKPSNILITADGEPKLLDFGIAAILDADDNEQTLVRALTPEYASPEQVSGKARSMATDVYSLGAVLNKLLTGQVRGAKGPAEPPAVTNKSAIPREVESVLKKALREEPNLRYPTVDALAGDIRAFLENRPVSARSGETVYRIQKFLRRNWVPVTAGVFVVAALSTGLYVANRARLVAQERFLQVRDLASDVFEFDEKIRNLPGSTAARSELVSLSLRYLARLASQATSDQDLAFRIASGYTSVAHVQGVPGFSNLGDIKAADVSLRHADAWIRAVLAARPKDRKALLLSAEIGHDRMILESMLGHSDESLGFAQESANRLDDSLKLGAPTGEDKKTAARLFADIALDNSNLHRGNDALRYCRRGVELARQAGDPDYLAGLLSLQSNVLRQQGDLEEALRNAQEARATLKSLPEDYSRIINLIVAIWREGRILGQDGDLNLDRPREAETALQEAYDLAEGLARRDPADYGARARVVAAARDLADIVRHRDPQRALEVYDAGLRRSAEIKNAESIRDRVRLLVGSAYPLRALKRSAEAKRRLDTGFQLLEQAKIWPAGVIRSGDVPQFALTALGDHYDATGRTSDAVETYQLIYDKLMASKPLSGSDLQDANTVSIIERRLAELDRKSGREEAATALDRNRRELWQRWQSRLPNNAFVRRQLSVQ